MNIENVILSNLIYNSEFTKNILPFIKEEYFSLSSQKTLFSLIKKYIDRYNDSPSLKTLAVELSNQTELSEITFKECKEVLVELSELREEGFNKDWLLQEAEKFCKEKALHNAIVESIDIIEKNGAKGNIPQLITDALSVSFSSSIGHDYFDDAEKRYDFYTKNENKLPFKLSMFNNITDGGLSKGTLTIIIAGTGVGKSLSMCNFAADNLMLGKNVLYITLEMSAKQIAKRIDSNLMDISINDLNRMNKEDFIKKIDRLKLRSSGKLVVEEYPTSAASTIHFKHLLNELKLKKGFVPDVIYIDYLGICASSRVKLSNQVNSYSLIKAVAEEVRALGIEYEVPVISAVQLNREGSKSSDPKLSDTSESFGVPFTADLMFGIVTNEELEDMNQMMVVQMKNRYNDLNRPRKFMIGVDKSKMRFYELDENNLTFNRTATEEETEEVNSRFDKKKVFNDFI